MAPKKKRKKKIKINSFSLFTQVIHMCLGYSTDLHMDAVFIAYFTLSTRFFLFFFFIYFMWFLLSWLISIEIMQILLVPSSPQISSSTWVFVCVCVQYSYKERYVACGFPVFCRFSSSSSSSSALSPFGVCFFWF